MRGMFLTDDRFSALVAMQCLCPQYGFGHVARKRGSIGLALSGAGVGKSGLQGKVAILLLSYRTENVSNASCGSKFTFGGR